MIMTVTLNPSVDIGYQLTEGFSLDNINRVNDVSKTAGGKGLNVARVLKQLNVDVSAAGFLGGSLGNFIRSEIENSGIGDNFTSIKDATRNCIAILHEGNQTEILEGGPNVSELEQERFMKEIETYISKVEYMTISGSLPKGVDNHFYHRILTISSDYKVPVLLDTKGDLLRSCLQHEHKPFLIKPNQDELADLIGVKLTEEADIVETLQHPMFEGVSWIVVTMGENGAIVKHGSRIYRVDIPSVRTVNPVGSGDSVIAGFSAGLSKGLSDTSLLTYALAMGILNAVEEKTGFINPENIEVIRKQIVCREYK